MEDWVMKKVGIIGTVGVPACYGGFETLAENLVTYAGEDIRYIVWCSAKAYPEKQDSYRGAELRYLPLKANGAQSTPFDLLSMIKALWQVDIMLILGVSGCLFLPLIKLLFKGKIIVNIDGLEHRRAKWGKTAKKFLLTSEKMAVRFADAVVADNESIRQYVRDTYGKEAALIAYGGDHVLRDVPPQKQEEILKTYGLEQGGYVIALCRIEPENNCDIILDAFSREGSPRLLFIGNWTNSEYGRSLLARYGSSSQVILSPAVYDPDTVFTLRSNARAYIHGHSAGGTNPSLVEAMHIGRPVYAFDCSYNRNTTFGKAAYFSTADELAAELNQTAPSGEVLQEIARKQYTWEIVTRRYEQLY